MLVKMYKVIQDHRKNEKINPENVLEDGYVNNDKLMKNKSFAKKFV